MNTLSYARSGAGETLLLLHGIGCSRGDWSAVVPALAEHFDVVAVDLPGFGATPPLPSEIEPTPAALASAVAELLDELGLQAPHVAGNSLGGWVALELAAARPVASLTLLSPAGLWRRNTPLYDSITLRATHWGARRARRLLERMVGTRVGRAVVFAQTRGRPARMTPQQARQAVRAMAYGPGFDAVMRATLHRHITPDPTIDAPVTVAFGSRDRVLLPFQSRHLDQLPPGTRVAELPGCGHIPMTDDPEAVVSLIVASTGGSAVPGPGTGAGHDGRRTRSDAQSEVIARSTSSRAARRARTAPAIRPVRAARPTTAAS